MTIDDALLRETIAVMDEALPALYVTDHPRGEELATQTRATLAKLRAAAKAAGLL